MPFCSVSHRLVRRGGPSDDTDPQASSARRRARTTQGLRSCSSNLEGFAAESTRFSTFEGSAIYLSVSTFGGFWQEVYPWAGPWLRRLASCHAWIRGLRRVLRSPVPPLLVTKGTLTTAALTSQGCRKTEMRRVCKARVACVSSTLTPSSLSERCDYFAMEKSPLGNKRYLRSAHVLTDGLCIPEVQHVPRRWTGPCPQTLSLVIVTASCSRLHISQWRQVTSLRAEAVKTYLDPKSCHSSCKSSNARRGVTRCRMVCPPCPSAGRKGRVNDTVYNELILETNLDKGRWK